LLEARLPSSIKAATPATFNPSCTSINGTNYCFTSPAFVGIASGPQFSRQVELWPTMPCVSGLAPQPAAMAAL
jgi:hypothetical protein